jgi:hypothetical protein
MKEDEKNVQTDCEESTMAAWNFFLMSIQNGEVNEDLSNEKSENGHYSDDFLYKYVKMTLFDRLEKGGIIYNI